MSDAIEIAPGIRQLDTLLGGMDQLTAGFLVDGPMPALIETGSQSSVPAVHAALDCARARAARSALDHRHAHPSRPCRRRGRPRPRLPLCDGRGARARSAPPGRSDQAHRQRVARVRSAARQPLRADDPVPEERLIAAGDGFRSTSATAAELAMVDSPGHAKHHHAVLDEHTGTLLVGDAVGVLLPDIGVLRPATPPPDFDLEQATHSLRRFAELRPEATWSSPTTARSPMPRRRSPRPRRCCTAGSRSPSTVMEDAADAGIDDVAAALADAFALDARDAPGSVRGEGRDPERRAQQRGRHRPLPQPKGDGTRRMTAAARPRDRLIAAVVLSAVIGLVGGGLAAWGIYARFGPVERVITQTNVVGPGSGTTPSVPARSPRRSRPPSSRCSRSR